MTTATNQEMPPIDNRQNAYPKVVALLPAYNAEKFIRDTLESLVAQTYPNLEVLISIDVSNDNTEKICRKMSSHDARFRITTQTERQGWIGNVNYLLNNAIGDYFFFAFHDDIVWPSYVESLVSRLEQSPDASLAYSDIELVELDGSIQELSFPQIENIDSRVERGRCIIQRRGLWWIPNRGLFRADAAHQIGGLKRHIAGEFAADWAWLLSLSLHGAFVRVPQPLCRKYYRAGSLSKTWRYSFLSWWSVSFSCTRQLAKSHLNSSEKRQLIISLMRQCWALFRRFDLKGQR